MGIKAARVAVVAYFGFASMAAHALAIRLGYASGDLSLKALAIYALPVIAGVGLAVVAEPWIHFGRR